MSESVLKLRNVTKKYSQDYVLNDVNMTIKKGDIYGLIGRNGAGKTTLTRIVTSLIPNYDGSVELFGEKTKIGLKNAQKRIGAVIETPSLYPDLTAYQNLAYYQKLKGIVDKDIINKNLEIVDLSATSKLKFKNFSLGMKQRLGIALVLLNNPDFIILDEPINGLDPMGIIEMREIINTLNKDHNITILILSHILTELSLVATNYGFIEKGKLLKELTSVELNNACNKSLILNIDNASSAATVLEEKIKTKNYKVTSKNEIRIYDFIDRASEINSELVRAGINVIGISSTAENLEDYFKNLIKEGN